jgi:epoxyqueuosine reductase
VSPDDIERRLRAAGLDLGFDQVGFAPASEPPNAAAYLAWLERGWHGEMSYMAREDALRRRLDPEQALPGCRTIIVVSLSYALLDSGAPEDLEQAVVARYARGRDYHGVFEERLAALVEVVEELDPEARTLPYVDYGPVLERDHAQRAGLGWIGKNTLLIDPTLGSYLLLGALLTTLELLPDDAFTEDRCGTCVRCIDACPTGAIRWPRGLDARLCISYLTIELRGAIPVELRPLIGNRIFGCDICQEVCPWNDGVPPGSTEELMAASAGGTGVPARKATPGRPVPPERMIEWAEELLELSDEAYRSRYRETAFARPGRSGMLRNLCVGLGNSGAREAVPVLRRCLEDRSELVEEHAVWALRRLEATVE